MKKVAVIGSGVMGASIAAHLANVGLPVLLLDIVPSTLTDKEEAKGLTLQSRKVRNRLASEAVQRALKQKPAPFTTKRNASLIEVGNIEDDLEKIKDVDWVIEVVVERLILKNHYMRKLKSIAVQEQLLVRILQVFQLKRWQKVVRTTLKNIS